MGGWWGLGELLPKPNLCFKIMLAAVQKMDSSGTTMETHNAKYFIDICAGPTIGPHFTEELVEAPF